MMEEIFQWKFPLYRYVKLAKNSHYVRLSHWRILQFKLTSGNTWLTNRTITRIQGTLLQKSDLSIWPHGNEWVDTFVALWSHHSWGPWPPSAVGNDHGVQVVPSYSDFSKLCGSSVSWPREVTAQKSLSTKECKENTQQWLGALLVNLSWFLETQSICNIPALLTNKQG